MKLTGEDIAEAMRQADMRVQYFPLRLLAAENRHPTTSGSENLNKIADAINAHMKPEAVAEAKLIVGKAREIHEDEGTIEIDDNATISLGEDGAYVAAWLFVSNSDLKAAGFDNPEAKGYVGG